jgi:mono/diheme cytochrome c family protein
VTSRSLLAALSLLAAAPGWAVDTTSRPPAEGYQLHCSGCHGPDARGVPGVSPTLHGIGSLLDREGGRAYLVRVPGVAQAPVSDAALAVLLNWLLETYSGAAPSPPYRAAEVGALREDPLRDPLAARAALER